MARLSTSLVEFGYTSFLVTGVPEPPQGLEPYILLNGWPKGWTEDYTKSNYYADDSVAAWCATRRRDYENGPRIRTRSRIPNSDSQQHLAGERPNANQKRNERFILIGMYAHARCTALMGCEPNGQRRRILRERDVLAWTAEGKSSWEIATIIGLSERTVIGTSSRPRRNSMP